MRFCRTILAILGAVLSGCSGVLFRAHITDIEISPRTLPPKGGRVKIVVKTYNADQVEVKFIRSGDGKTFFKYLSQEFSWSFLYGEQKWDGEITLPPNNDPEGRDQVYSIIVKAWKSGGWGWEHERSGGKVIVKGKSESSLTNESQSSDDLKDKHVGELQTPQISGR
ncbi:MAG: hypothetical protein ACK4I8_08210 [Armatimonadota bacterium]